MNVLIFHPPAPSQSMEQFNGRVRPLNCHPLGSCLLLTQCKQMDAVGFPAERFAREYRWFTAG